MLCHPATAWVTPHTHTHIIFLLTDRTPVVPAPLVGEALPPLHCSGASGSICVASFLSPIKSCFFLNSSNLDPNSWHPPDCSRPHMAGLGRTSCLLTRSSSHQVTLLGSGSSSRDASLCRQAGTFWPLCCLGRTWLGKGQNQVWLPLRVRGQTPVGGASLPLISFLPF